MEKKSYFYYHYHPDRRGACVVRTLCCVLADSNSRCSYTNVACHIGDMIDGRVLEKNFWQMLTKVNFSHFRQKHLYDNLNWVIKYCVFKWNWMRVIFLSLEYMFRRWMYLLEVLNFTSTKHLNRMCLSLWRYWDELMRGQSIYVNVISANLYWSIN